MIDYSSILDGQLTQIILRIVSSYITHYTQRVHGTTLKFVSMLAIGVGIVLTILFNIYGADSFWDGVTSVVMIALTVLAYANAFFTIFLKAKNKEALQSEVTGFVVKVLEKGKNNGTIKPSK